MRLLDRYILDRFHAIFGVCVFGLPIFFIVIDLTDQLDSYLAEGTAGSEVLLHYIYQFPYHGLLAFPIAALLAAVFTVSVMTRHFETTAAKATGVSFYRLTSPILLSAFGLSLVALVLTELVPGANRKAEEVLGTRPSRSESIRSGFVFRGNRGRVYRIGRLDVRGGQIDRLEIDREGTGFGYPTYRLSAEHANWDSAGKRWVIHNGRIRFFPELETTLSFRFRELLQRPFTETPEELLADPKDPDHMGYFELGRFIDAIERSGGNARDLMVERALKISFPFTCFIIVLFGLPLAHSTRRGGAPMSIGIALLTTILFLMVVRIAQALGAGGVVSPTLAAWLPNLLFLSAGMWLMGRVRT